MLVDLGFDFLQIEKHLLGLGKRENHFEGNDMRKIGRGNDIILYVMI